MFFRYEMATESTEDEDAKATIDSLMKAAEEELTLHSSIMLVPSSFSYPPSFEAIH